MSELRIRKLAVLLGLLGLLVLLAWWQTGEDPAPAEHAAVAPLSPPASATNDSAGSGGDPPAAEVASEAAVELPAGQVDVAAGSLAIHGRVHDPWGAPQADATVTVMAVDLPEEVESERGLPLWRWRLPSDEAAPRLSRRYRDLLTPVVQLRTGEEGRYRVAGLAPGSYAVAARIEGCLNTPGSEIVELQAVDATDASSMADTNSAAAGAPQAMVPTVDLYLQEAANLSGRVLDPQGAPVAGAPLELIGDPLDGQDELRQSLLPLEDLLLLLLNPLERAVVTDAAGEFRLNGLVPVESVIHVQAARWAPLIERCSLPIAEPLTLVLSEGGAVRGWVEGGDGEPLAGANVRLLVNRTSLDLGPLVPVDRSRETETDDDGSFLFTDVAVAEVTITATAAGHRARTLSGLRITAGEELEVVASLATGAVLSGIVVDEAGEPLSEVRVQLTGAGRARTRTAEDGSFRFDTLRDREYRAEFRHERLAVHRQRVRPDPAPIEVVLMPGVELTAQLIDELGQPLVGAKLWVWSRASGTRATLSDDQGEVRVSGLSRGKHRVTIRAPGCVTVRESLDVFATDLHLGTIELRPAPVVTGVVLGPDGLPVAGARVFAVQDQVERGERRQRAAARTRHDGAFTLPLPVAGTRWRLTASYPLLLSEAPTRQLVPANGLEGLILRLAWGAAISGTVFAADGGLVPGARVSVKPRRGRTIRARCAPDGSFLISGLGPGKLRLLVEAPGYARHRDTSLELAADEQRSVEVILEPERILTGVVMDELGYALTGAEVRVTGSAAPAVRRTVTRADGSFAIGSLADGEATVRVVRDQHAPWREKFTIERQGLFVEVVLIRTHELSGLVFDRFTGQPLAGARIRAQQRQASSSGSRRESSQRRNARSDAQGIFTVSGLKSGGWLLSVEARGYVAATGIELQVPGDLHHGVEIGLDPGGRIEGELSDRRGDPVAQARVSVFRLLEDAEGKEKRVRVGRVRSTADGLFEVVGLVGGSYRLVVDHANYLPMPIEPVELDLDRQPPFVRRTLDPGARIEGKVFDRHGRPVKRGQVTLEQVDGTVKRRVRVISAGGYSLRQLPAGRYRLAYREGKQSETLATVAVPAGERREVDLYRTRD